MRRSAPSSGPRGHARAGFSLIEVLVALAISGLCLVMVSGLIGRLVATRRAVHDHTAILNQGDAVFRLIRGLVASVEVERLDATQPNLVGQAQTFEVQARGPVVLDLGAETRFKIHVVGTPSSGGSAGGRLAIAWSRPSDGAAFDETVATGVAAFALAYRSRGGLAPWTSQWSGPVADLGAIRATLTFVDAPGAGPVSAVFAVGHRLPRACVIDPRLAACPSW